MYAVRNIKLCTKDCLCLYVCPTGASDTETGQIDPEKCLDGCRACVDACPSHAISLIPDTYPKQQEKTDDVKHALLTLTKSKTMQAAKAEAVADNTNDPATRRLAAAVAMSNRLMAEDLLREAGYMLPQSQNVIDLLSLLSKEQSAEDFPYETVNTLTALLKTK